MSMAFSIGDGPLGWLDAIEAARTEYARTGRHWHVALHPMHRESVMLARDAYGNYLAAFEWIPGPNGMQATMLHIKGTEVRFDESIHDGHLWADLRAPGEPVTV